MLLLLGKGPWVKICLVILSLKASAIVIKLIFLLNWNQWEDLIRK
jgi:hypothetical protein